MARKRCEFCGRSDVKISNEHAWPNWVRRLFPPGPTTILGHRNKDQQLGAIRYVVNNDMGVRVNSVCTE
jgi:hypothetical protein